MNELNFLPAKDPLPVSKSYGLLKYLGDPLYVAEQGSVSKFLSRL